MSDPKIIVSTPVDPDVVAKLDTLCGSVHKTRAEVIRGLLYALLVEGRVSLGKDGRFDGGTGPKILPSNAS